jgi:pyrimidine/purine-5'-nucleotide nucleosidase
VFCILRNARVLDQKGRPDLVVCWGGHSISREEYEYTKDGRLRARPAGLNVCTGCGPGAMKGPMKGATIGHSKQRIHTGRYIGLTEPGIVAAEPPNPIVNQLVIMPDIEKRLEAFVRLGHGIIVFPGGVGTAEEILYLLGVLLEPQNARPAGSAGVHRSQLVGAVLRAHPRVRRPDARARGAAALPDHRRRAGGRRARDGLRPGPRAAPPQGHRRRVQLQLDAADPAGVPAAVRGHARVVEALDLHLDQPVHARAANLRRVFSAIVAGNVKEPGIRQIEQRGPFTIHGDTRLMRALDELLASFVAQKRMKISGEYKPVYRVVA